MIYDLQFRVEVSSVQHATALRDRIGVLLTEETTLIDAHQAQALTSYTVKGVDTTKGTLFSEQVEAEDAEAAEQKVVSKTRIVVSVA